eukprot:Em0004g1750a
MAEFQEALAYSLLCVNQQNLVLKAKQEEALFHLYNGRDVFAWFPTGYGKSVSGLQRKGVPATILSGNTDKLNITYEAVQNTIEEDFSSVVRDLAERNITARRVVVYCQSLDIYYPPGVEQVSDNRLFAMFHSCTDEHNKRVVMSSLSQADGVVRVVFATMALGMGVDFKSLDYVIHYGAPRSLEDYMQESGRAGLTIRINSAPFKQLQHLSCCSDVEERLSLSLLHLNDSVKCLRHLPHLSLVHPDHLYCCTALT